MPKLKCPFKKDKSGFDSSTIFGECYEEEYAWWDADEERCCVPQLVRELDRLVDRVNDVELLLRAQLGGL